MDGVIRKHFLGVQDLSFHTVIELQEGFQGSNHGVMKAQEMSRVTHFFSEYVTWIYVTGDVGHMHRVVLVQFMDQDDH